MSLKTKKIGFIGGGNMAEALIAGLLTQRALPRTGLWVFDPNKKRQRLLQKKYGVRLAQDNAEVVGRCSIIILAVKPQILADILQEISPTLKGSHLVISIAAGIDTASLRRPLGSKTRLIRTMPNTPALVGAGVTGLYAAPTARPIDRRLATELFSSVGTVITVRKEAELDWITALSGSGPAYVYHFLEGLTEAGTQGGLSKGLSQKLALATVQGATALVANTSEDFKALRRKVTSKGGTTAAAMDILTKKGWAKILRQAVAAAAKRAQQLRG